MWDKKTYVQSSLPTKAGQHALFIGRWQPLHLGHQEMFKQAMNEGKNVLIAIRDIEPDEKNPFSAQQVKENIETFYSDLISEEIVKVIVISEWKIIC
jgi:cytidyltransferase-like protein